MVWQTMLQLLRALWHRLCGYESLRSVDRTEHQQLLGHDTISSAAASPEPLVHAVQEPLPPATIIVMRHGHRQVLQGKAGRHGNLHKKTTYDLRSLVSC